MPTQAEVVWDPGFTRYDFGPTHPMSPMRLDLTARLCDAFGLFDHEDVRRLDPGVASDAELETVHSPAYVAAVKAASADPDEADDAYGLGTDDDPAFVGMHEASARAARDARRRLLGRVSPRVGTPVGPTPCRGEVQEAKGARGVAARDQPR